MFRRISLLAATAALLALGACGKPTEQAKTEKPVDATSTAAASAPASETILVSSAKVERTSVATPIVGSGNIAPVRMTDIGPSVDGIIEAVNVNVGDVVKKGQQLFKTRDVDIRLQVQEMEKQVALARAQNANAQAELQRQSSLTSGGWVSKSRMDTTKANADVARAQLGVWEARLAQARQALSDTVVRAPYSGVITRKDVYEGRFMATRMGGMGGGASGVVQIMDIETVAVIVNVPETYLSQLKLGMKVRVHVDGLQDTYEAELLVINHRVDTQTRSVELRTAIANKNLAIKPGLFCRAEFEPAPREVLAVDRDAVLGGEGARYAFMAENGRAKKITLTTRDLDSKRVEITSNVPAGTVLLKGSNLARLVDGMAVTVEDGAKPAAPKAASL